MSERVGGVSTDLVHGPQSGGVLVEVVEVEAELRAELEEDCPHTLTGAPEGQPGPQGPQECPADTHTQSDTVRHTHTHTNTHTHTHTHTRAHTHTHLLRCRICSTGLRITWTLAWLMIGRLESTAAVRGSWYT